MHAQLLLLLVSPRAKLDAVCNGQHKLVCVAQQLKAGLHDAVACQLGE
jgi:hypothetical protein